MKKLVLAMACVLSLALLASCKQEAASSDVTVSNQVANYSYSYKGTVSGTFTPQKANTAGDAWTADDSYTGKLAGDNTWGYSTIAWDVKMGDNYTTYTLTPALNFKATSSSDAVKATLPAISFYKLGDKYYMDSYQANYDPSETPVPSKAEIKFKDDGSPEDDEFTILDLGYVSYNTKVWKITNLKFTKWSE